MYDNKIIFINFLLFISICLIIVTLLVKKHKKYVKNKDEQAMLTLESPLLSLDVQDNSIGLTSRFNNYLKLDDYEDGIRIITYDRFNNNLPVTFGNDLNISQLDIRGDLNIYKDLSIKGDLNVSNSINVDQFMIGNESGIQLGENGPYLSSGYNRDLSDPKPILSWGKENNYNLDRCVLRDVNYTPPK